MDSIPSNRTAAGAGHEPGGKRPSRPGRRRYAVVPGRVEENKPDVLALARRNLAGPPEQPELRFRKYYEGSPLGPPFFFLAEDPGSRRYVGMAALFRTTLSIAGEPVPAGISGDFAVDEEHRGFGPALALQRATLSAIPENGLACAYGSPNPFSEPLIERVGYTDVGRLTRFLKPLQARIVVEAYVRRPRLARLASAALSVTADPLLTLMSRERRARLPPDLSIERPATFDGDRFANVFESIRRQHGITGERDARLLNWKYGLGGAGAEARTSRSWRPWARTGMWPGTWSPGSRTACGTCSTSAVFRRSGWSTPSYRARARCPPRALRRDHLSLSRPAQPPHPAPARVQLLLPRRGGAPLGLRERQPLARSRSVRAGQLVLPHRGRRLLGGHRHPLGLASYTAHSWLGLLPAGARRFPGGRSTARGGAGKPAACWCWMRRTWRSARRPRCVATPRLRP